MHACAHACMHVRAVFRLDWPKGLHGSALPRRLLVVTTGGPQSRNSAPQSRAGQGAAVAGRDDDYCGP